MWRSLRARFFLAHVAVIAVAGVALTVAAFAATPRILALQAEHMQPMMAMSGRGPAAMSAMLDAALDQSYRDAIGGALLAGGVAALIAAVAVSAIATSAMARPMRRLADAAGAIASGRYDHRAPPSGIDELDRVAASFNEMAATIAATEQRRSELLGDVAHELRTPLATLDGYLEGLADGVVEPDAATWTLLRGETRRMIGLVADIAQLSRAEAGQLDLDVQAVAPAAIVEQACAGIAADAAVLGLRLETSIAPDLPAVHADRERAVQILVNLLANAVRYTPPPGVISVEVRQDGDGVRFAVSDNGIGIGAGDLPHVFERFYRVDKSRSRAYGGSGVGLTIARALAEAMNGRLTAESAGLGKGSTFTLWLPCQSAPPR
jgi:signal transduction histidine kinase